MIAGVADPDGLDWWMDTAGPAEVRTGFEPLIDTLEGVLPLDPGFDQATTGCVPQQLRAPLFGPHPMPDTAAQMARSQEAGGSAAQTHALSLQHFNLPKLQHHVFGFVSLSSHF